MLQYWDISCKTFSLSPYYYSTYRL